MKFCFFSEKSLPFHMQFFTNEKEIRYYTTSIFCCETDSSFFPFCNVFVNAERNAFARAADLDSELEFSITDDTKKNFFSSFILYTFIQNIHCHSCYIYFRYVYNKIYIFQFPTRFSSRSHISFSLWCFHR